MKNSKILFFCMIIVGNNAVSQTNQLKPNAGKDFIKSYFYSPIEYKLFSVENLPVSPKFYVNNLGFFCKQELKLQSITRVPFKFRLGSMQYNDWMEGKINAGVKPGN